jgi:hypothetical protein
VNNDLFPWIEYEHNDTRIKCQRCGREVIMPNYYWRKDNKVFQQFLDRHGRCKGLGGFL